jgi:hypothetical protein
LSLPIGYRELAALSLLLSCAPLLAGGSETNLSRLSIQVLANLPREISLAQLSVAIGIKPRHQFTARVGTADVVCVSVTLERPKASLYFVFGNDKLEAIQEPPKFEFEVRTYEGKPWQVPKPVESEGRMRKVLQGEHLSPRDIEERVNRWLAAEAAASNRREPLNILPAFVIVAPLLRSQAPASLRSEREAQRLARMYDPFQIKLGMTADEVQAVFGKPATRAADSNSTVHVYGAALPRNISIEFPPIWLSVVFCDGKAVRVFSHDFFDKRLAP